MMRHQSEKGAAMVLVLGIVAVMSSLAIFSFDSLTRLIALTTAKNYAAQTDHYARGAELVAIDVGRRLIVEKVPLRVLVNQGQNRFQQNIDDAQIIGELQDATNCFNLASLVTGNRNEGYAADMEAVEQFARLLQLKGLGAQAALAVASALADWQDSDTKPLPLGAESAFYADRAPYYQTPNVPLSSVSEFRLIRDVTPTLIEALGDLICVDPIFMDTVININMLQPRHATLLSAILGADASEASMQNLIAGQPEQGFSDSQRFWAHPLLAYGQFTNAQKRKFFTLPRRIRVLVDVELSGVKNRMKSHIHFYPNGSYTMISRVFGDM